MMDSFHYNILNLVGRAAENVGYPYYKVTTSENPQKLHDRERVFCYELYHRMRQIQDNYCKDLTINGELDKSGRLDYDSEKPDFLFHIPGTDNHNEAIIEVKNVLQVEADLKKINVFIKHHKYKVGILFVYNHSLIAVEKFIKKNNELFDIECKDKIYIIAGNDPAHIKCKSLMEITGG